MGSPVNNFFILLFGGPYDSIDHMSSCTNVFFFNVNACLNEQLATSY